MNKNKLINNHRLVGNEIWCSADSDNCMCHICAKNNRLNFGKAIIDKISILHEIAQNFPYFRMVVILKSIIGN